MTWSAKLHKSARNRRLLAGAAIVSVSLGVLAGCGASSSSKLQPQQAVRTPAQSSADAGGAGSQAQRGAPSGARTLGMPLTSSGQTHSGPVPERTSAVQRARSTPASTSDDTRGEKQAALNPCRLVSAAEAQAIVGAPIAGQLEAPLGPTCVYRLSGSSRQITLAIESLGFHQVTHEMTRPRPITVGHRRAYCGRLGTSMLFVPLRPGRVLNVTAPCSTAQRFAALALSRLRV